MITGTLERDRSCLHTSVPDIPGNIRSSSTMSAPARSNSLSADGPSVTTVASKPSLRRRKASGSASDSSSSTISTLVIGATPSHQYIPHRWAGRPLHRRRRASSTQFFLSLGSVGPHFAAPRQLDLVAVLVNRDGQRERRSGPDFAPHADTAVMIGRNMFDDRQPQPAAARGSRAGLVSPEEPLEDSFLVL